MQNFDRTDDWKRLDSRRLANYLMESLELSKEHLRLVEGCMSFDKVMEQKITHCQVEKLISVLQSAEFRT